MLINADVPPLCQAVVPLGALAMRFAAFAKGDGLLPIVARSLLNRPPMKANSLVLKMGVVVVIWAVGCGGSTAAPDANGSAGQGGSSGQAGSGGNAAGSSAGGATADAGMDACPPPSGANPKVIGLSSSAPINVNGTVGRVDLDRLEIVTSAGPLNFAWVGPPLDAAFSAGEEIQIVRTREYPGAESGWSVVRSARTTAAVRDGTIWKPLATTPGSTHTVDVPSDFPALRYPLESCCPVGDHGSRTCSYGPLEATYDAWASHIDLGTTGRVGPWSITNVASSFYVDGSGEMAWGNQVTLLGPATARAVDGGT
jgi:hypothetical protein